MSNFDSIAECDAILAHATALFGGRTYEDAIAPTLNADGSFAPYLVIQFGTPVPKATGRGLGTEKVQPHILPVLMMVVAHDSSTARRGAGSVLNRFLDFAPNGGGNAGGLTGGKGQSFPIKNAAGAVIRVERVVLFECVLNLAPASQ